jgi:hypothetical protein
MKSLDDAPPLHSGIMETDEQAQAQAQLTGPQIVEALRGVLIPETIHTLPLDHQFILNEDVGKVLSDSAAFIADSQRDLGVSADAARREFPKQGTLADFLWKSAAQGIGNLKDGAEHTLRQGI